MIEVLLDKVLVHHERMGEIVLASVSLAFGASLIFMILKGF